MRYRELHWLWILALVVGCNETKEPQAMPQTQPRPAQAGPNPPNYQPEQSRVGRVPFVVTLNAPNQVADNSTFNMDVQIQADNPMATPTMISLQLPPGAVLQSGNPQEQLSSLPSGLTTRSYQIHVQARPTPETPIRVIVDMRSPDGSFGSHAERTYPAAPAAQTTTPSNVPPPPMARPGGPVMPERLRR